MSDRLHISHQFWPGQIARGLFTGLLSGLAISLYAEVIFLVTDVNKMNPWLIIAIPFGAVLTQYLFKFFGERYRTSTASAIDDINHHKDAHKNWVQIGLACSSVVEKCEARINHMLSREHDNRSDYYLMCGAAAAFSALFDAPIAGVLFGTQLASPKATRLDAYLPCITASFSAWVVADLLHCHVLEIPMFGPLDLTYSNLAIVVVFAVLTGLYSRLFCFVLHTIRDFFRKRLRNTYWVVAWPALLLLLFSFITFPIFDTFRYNGLGGDLLYDIIIGRATQMDDLIKLVMVALTFAAGFVGGEVVPLMIVGAGFGMSMSYLFDMPLSPFAVLGSVGMLSGGTNLPLVCFALGMELYGYKEPTMLFLMVTVSFLASGRSGIYAHQKLPYR